MGDEMFHVTDRKGAENALGMTEEEAFATSPRKSPPTRRSSDLYQMHQVP